MQGPEIDAVTTSIRSALLALKCEIAARRVVLAAEKVASRLRKAGFNPDQPRDDGGRWTDAGAGDDVSDDTGDDPQPILVGGPGSRSGYRVDILDEASLGGHTHTGHVGKSDEYLKARVIGSRTSIAGIVTFGRRRAGSFTSIEAAIKLVNSTLSQNIDKVEEFVAGGLTSALPFKFLFADFESPTGFEAYAPNDWAQPRMRPTYGVTVLIRRTQAAEKGFYVQSSWPSNKDWDMHPEAPPIFKRMCWNFGPDLDDLVTSWDDLVLLALHNLDVHEARTIAPYIDDLIGGRFNDEDLKEFWWTMPVTSAFNDGKDVREFLRRLREALSRPPYGT